MDSFGWYSNTMIVGAVVHYEPFIRSETNDGPSNRFDLERGHKNDDLIRANSSTLKVQDFNLPGTVKNLSADF